MTTNRRAIAILAVAIAAFGFTACSDQPVEAPATTAADTAATVIAASVADSYPGDRLAALPLRELTDDDVAALVFMREEEKLARDVYLELAEMWGLRVFENIAGSESTHMDAVLELLDRYDLADPAGGPGEFTDPALQALYDRLIAQGSQSLTDALLVGATIEEVDIVDLELRIATTDNDDIQLVFTNLLNGSQNHLRAFTGQLERKDFDYEPSYLSEADYQAILAGSNTRGNDHSS